MKTANAKESIRNTFITFRIPDIPCFWMFYGSYD